MKLVVISLTEEQLKLSYFKTICVNSTAALANYEVAQDTNTRPRGGQTNLVMMTQCDGGN